MTVIFIIIAVLFLILIAWTWHSLGNIEKSKKVAYIIVGTIAVWGITFILYNISKTGIQYQNENVMKTMQSIYVLIFTIVNGYILLPYVFKMLDKIENNEIEKNVFKKKIIIMFALFTIISIIECNYLANVQQGTLDIIKK